MAAVIVPSFLKEALRLAILSGRASLGPSSSLTTVLLPFLSAISTGAISALNAPSACAFCARRVDSSAYSSCAARENLKSAAHFSPHIPMCMSLYGSQSPSWIIRSLSSVLPMRAPVRAECVKYGALDIDSIPPATTTSASPSAMTRAPSMTASSPEPQTLLTVTQGTVFGMPA